MARRYGTAGSISSLISSARSAYERQQSYQDQIAAYEWDLSAKTAEDHDRYVSYLNKRRQQVEAYDPSKALSIASKINSARSTFTSNELKRASLAINYGQGTDSDKYNKMFSLYQNALNNNDFDLAQTLELQLGNLERKIKDAAQAAANAASAASDKAYTASKKTVEAEIRSGKSALKDIETAYKERQVNPATGRIWSKNDVLKAKRDIAGSLDSYYQRVVSGQEGQFKPEDMDTFASGYRDWRNSNDFKQNTGLTARQTERNPSLLVKKPDGTFESAPVVGYSQVNKRDNPNDPFIGDFQPTPLAGKSAGDLGKQFKKLGYGGNAENGSIPITATDPMTGEPLTGLRGVLDASGKAIVTVDSRGQKYLFDPKTNTLKFLADSEPGKDGSIIPADVLAKLDSEQQKAAQAESYKGVMGVGRQVYDAIGMTGRQTLKTIGSAVGSQFGKNKLNFNPGSALQQVADRSVEILGLRKRAEEKAMRDAAERQRMLEANRAEAARQQASFQAQLAKSNVPSIPGTQLTYNWKTGKVENKLSPVFKDPLANDPNKRAEQVIRGGLAGNSVLNRLR